VTLDWQTMEYNQHKEVFQNARKFSACAKLKGQNGETLVAVAAGELYPAGLEAWNPATGSVTMLTPDFPKSYFLGAPAMISVNDGSSLIYYEARDMGKGVFKYDVADNSWTKIGELLKARDDFAAVPVFGIQCD